jgi:hypothetical protein
MSSAFGMVSAGIGTISSGSGDPGASRQTPVNPPRPAE